MNHEQDVADSLKFQATSLPPFDVLEIASAIPCGQPETYGATPLDYAAVYAQQSELLYMFLDLVDVNVDESIPQGIREYMKDTFVMRFQGRATANHEKYLCALQSAEKYANNTIAYEMIQRALRGHSSPAELILVREMLGMPGIEIGCVSHPYGKRVEEVDVMRQVVGDSIALLGGTNIKDPEPRYRVKGVVNEPMWAAEYTEGFLMTRKRDVGIMPDGTVIRERTSFILRGDVEGVIPRANVNAIRKLNPRSPTWQADVVKAGGLDVIAEALLAADEFSLVIPVSSTMYGFNTKTIAEVEEKRQAARQKLQEEREIEMMERFPELLSHIDQLHSVSRSGRRAPATGLFFVRPTDSDD